MGGLAARLAIIIKIIFFLQRNLACPFFGLSDEKGTESYIY